MSAMDALRALISAPYGGALALRSRCYRSGLFASRALACPVLSVGNLTFGGTGKTPFTIWLAKEIAGLGRKPGILSRGYGGGPDGNDEAAVIRDFLPDVPHVQNPDRVAGGRELVEKHGVEAIVLDDGFQHLRLRRDLDLLLVDATDPFGGGFCPPGGRLREPLSAIRRADLAILTRADLVSESEREAIWKTILRYKPELPRVELAFRPAAALETESGKAHAPEALRNRGAVLLSAVGNPAAFRRAAESVGVRVRREFAFRDHHRYAPEELRRVFSVDPQALVLTTRKDWVKIRAFPEFRPWVLDVEPRFLRGDGFLACRLEELFPRRG